MNVLIVGLPFYAHKYEYLINTYARLGYKVDVLFNSSNVNVPEEIMINKMFLAGTSPFSRICKLVKIIKNEKPDYIDCYDYSILTILFLLIAKFFKIKTRLWLIGGELKNDITHLNKTSLLNVAFVRLKTLFTKLSLFCADNILAKELHHLEQLKSLAPKLINKTTLIYNCVPVKQTLPQRDFSQLQDFIYANAVIKSRNVDKMLCAFNQLKIKNLTFSASIYGFNSISNDVYAVRGFSYSNNVLALYNSYNFDDCVSVYGFEKNIQSQFGNYKFFILLGDVIFANYALLESMANGVVPIVFPGNGYEKLVIDGHNGIVVSAGNVEQALERALALTENEYFRLSQNAHDKIKKEFSIALWQSKLKNSFF